MSENLWTYDRTIFHTFSNYSALSALDIVTDMVIVAHPDDAEIMAPDLILECQNDPDRCLGVLIVTDGRGAPRKDDYADYTDQRLAETRTIEQVDAALEGKYHFLAMTQHPDKAEFDLNRELIAKECFRVLRNCPNLKNLVTHNTLDNHAGHRNVCAGVVTAARMLSDEMQSQIKTFRGGEVWGEISMTENTPYLQHIDLSSQAAKIQMDTLRKHDSQVKGAMDYNSAIKARQLSRGVLCNPFNTNANAEIMLSMDLMPFIQDKNLEPKDYNKKVMAAVTKVMLDKVDGLSMKPLTGIESEATSQRAIESLERARTNG